MESNNNNNNNNNNENNNNSNNNNTDRAEWKIQLVMQNNFISDKIFEDTGTMYSASKPVEIFMDSDTALYYIIIFKKKTLEEVNHI